MASNVSINELLDVLKKSGVTFNSGADMKAAAPFARDQISQTVQGQDTQLPALKSNYKAQLDQIAMMDQKLAGVYGDPTSKLFIENPLKREQLMTPAKTTGYRAAGDIATMFKGASRDLESKTDDALSLYKKLATKQAADEKAAKKGKSTGSGTTYSKKDLLYRTGFRDKETAQAFLNKPTAFQKEWVDTLLSHEYVPEKGFSVDDVETEYKLYEETQAKKKAAAKKSTTGKTTKTALF